MTTTGPEYESVVETVRRWPAKLQFSLLHEVLHVLAAGQPHRSVPTPSDVETREPNRRATLAHATGLLKTSGTPPTDAEVRRLLDERRIEKFG